MTKDEELNSPEAWRRDLAEAGWTNERSTVWKSPSGHLFRGPYDAWCKMHAEPLLSIPKLSNWPEESSQ